MAFTAERLAGEPLGSAPADRSRMKAREMTEIGPVAYIMVASRASSSAARLFKTKQLLGI